MFRVWIIVSTLIVLSVLLLSACPDHINLPPPPNLKGNYTGSYTLVTNSANDTISENILWQFQDQFFYMKLDSSSFNGHCFCAVSGDYILGDSVHLRVLASQTAEKIASCTSCNVAENPDGLFDLYQSEGTLRLTLQYSDTLKELLLILITDN